MDKIAVIGTTSWGITLGLLMAAKGSEVCVWARTQKEANRLTKKGLDPARFPEVTVPQNLTFSSKMPEVLAEAAAVILAVPSPTMRQNVSAVAPFVTKGMVVVSVSKGLETGSNKRMSEVIAEEIGERFAGNVCTLSGPNLAREIQQHLPAAAVVAAENMDTARKAQRLLTGPRFCVFTNTDITGVELGGALKNIIALGAGIADGLNYGDNAKSAFITRGLTEITALGMTLGANPLTFSGLAGLGDVVATCASPLSRNHYVGTELAKGRKLAEILDAMDEVAEGVTTVLAAHDLAQQHGLEMPITEKLYKVLYEDYDPRQAAEDLMGGNVKHELAGRRWRLFSLFRHRRRTTAPKPPAA
jgi:glycerol-3-phosphate dehydrogenase (NAD(P)+)